MSLRQMLTIQIEIYSEPTQIRASVRLLMNIFGADMINAVLLPCL